MAKTVGDIAINVSADIGPLVREMGRAGTATTKFGKVTKKVSYQLGKFGDKTIRLGKQMSLVSGAVAAAATAAFALANGTAQAGDKIAKSARGAGVSADYYQEMAYAIGQVSDVTEDEFASSMQRLTKSIGEGADGTLAQVEALEKLGFTQSQIASGSITTQQAFDAYIEKMDGLKDPAIAAAISNDLLGRTGVRLGAQLAGGAASVDALRGRAQELGIVLSKDALDSSEKFGDQMDDLKRSFESVRLKLGAELLPLFTDKLIPLIQEKVVPALIDFGDKVGDIIQWFDSLPAPVQEAMGVVAAAFAVGGPLMIGIGLVSKALGALVAATGPVGLFIAAATLAYAAWEKWGEDIEVAVGDSLDWVTEKFEKFVDYIKGIPDMLLQVGRDMIQGLLDGVTEKWEELKKKIYELADAMPVWMKDLLGIHSPSRVFMEIGGFIGQGLADGIAASQSLVSDAVGVLANGATSATDGMVSSVLSSLGSLFKGSKTIAVAQALVNTWQGATEALKLPFPANLAAFAQTAATGLAAVKSIKSASPSGGGSGGGAAASATPAAPQERRVAEFRFMGGNVLDPSAIVDAMNDAYDQGYQVKGILA